MFTVPSYRRIDTYLEYVVNVININDDSPLRTPITYARVNQLDECVKAIEDYRNLYLTKEDYALFVEIRTTIANQDVRLEAFWVDK